MINNDLDPEWKMTLKITEWFFFERFVVSLLGASSNLILKAKLDNSTLMHNLTFQEA